MKKMTAWEVFRFSSAIAAAGVSGPDDETIDEETSLSRALAAREAPELRGDSLLPLDLPFPPPRPRPTLRD